MSFNIRVFGRIPFSRNTRISNFNTVHLYPSFNTLSSRSYATYTRFNNSKSQPQWRDWITSRNGIYVGIGLVGFYVYNLNEAPISHRLRFLWVPDWMERKIGDYSYKQIVNQYRNQIVPTNNHLYDKIGKIMNRLLAAAIANSDEHQRKLLTNLDWSIHIIQVDPKEVPPNAFILPNGKIFIFSSILPICKNDDGLATVLAHELSHQLAHHSAEQLSKQPFYIMMSTILYSLTGISWFNELLISGILSMPASREMESEADYIGCELMAKSCFNVKEAANFWGRMSQFENSVKRNGLVNEGLLQEFFSTHPATTKRLNDINARLSDLEAIKEASGCYEYFNDFASTSRNFFKRI